MADENNYRSICSGRCCNIELMRFIGIFLIMGHHLYLIGFTDNYLFKNCWVWVDFFFILTGAFTYRHFEKSALITEQFGSEALAYTYSKFARFFPMTILSVIIMCFLRYRDLLFQNGWRLFFATIAYTPFEMCYLSSSGIVSALNAPIWFLSAMFITLPMIVFLIQKHRELWKVASFSLPIMYFGYKGVNTERVWPNDIIRAFVCMALGTMAFMLAERIREYIVISNFRKVFCSFAEIMCVFLAIYISAMNKSCINLMEPLFVILIALLLSQSTLTAAFKNALNKICVVLGKISMPMFIFHWCVGSMCVLVTSDIRLRILIYYMGTIAIGVTWMIVYQFLQMRRNKNEL